MNEDAYYVFHALWDTGNKTHATMMLFQSPSASAARDKGKSLLGLTAEDKLIAATVFETTPVLADDLRQRGLAMHTAE